ncbi:MAG: TetR family transcriptional regulator [Cyanothece sp. SIO1E1]|nr:TetR family transcriptional regulator [Cyanothece sp. SIO1E1]
MTAQRRSTRKRLVQAALELFAAQGVTETTTRQIAELADVNEVTLFRHFGSKHGLLLAVIEEAEVFTQLGEVLGQRTKEIRNFDQALQAYADVHLQALEGIPEFVRSLVGEAGQYPIENRQAIGRGLAQVQRYTMQYLNTITAREQFQFTRAEAKSSQFSATKIASFINVLLLGYAVMEFTTEFHQLWPSRDAFIADLVELLLAPEYIGETSVGETSVGETSVHRPSPAIEIESIGADLGTAITDLPAPLVRAILQTARQSGLQDYALVYVLFGAGLSPKEVAGLKRSHSMCDSQQHVLQILPGASRQVPLNQWIMGHHYGSYRKNPLTQWLKSREDELSALFINADGNPISELEIRQCWQAITADIVTPSGSPPQIEQAQHTWRVEMLVRGMSQEDLSLLSGCTPQQLQPYVRRAQARAALEQAIRLDQRPAN